MHGVIIDPNMQHQIFWRLHTLSARQRHKQYWGAKLTAAVGWYGSAFATPHQYNKTTMLFCKLLSLLIFIYVCIRKSHLPPSNLKPRLKILQAHFVCSIESFPHLNKVSIVNGRVTLRVPCCSRSFRLKKLSGDTLSHQFRWIPYQGGLKNEIGYHFRDPCRNSSQETLSNFVLLFQMAEFEILWPFRVWKAQNLASESSTPSYEVRHARIDVLTPETWSGAYLSESS